MELPFLSEICGNRAGGFGIRLSVTVASIKTSGHGTVATDILSYEAFPEVASGRVF